jgi:hypothetical protein
MKTPIYRQFSFLLATILIASSTISQSSNFVEFNKLKFSIPYYKEDSKGHRTFSDPVVSSKTLNVFAGMFKGASDVRWFELDNKFLVKFIKDGRETTALYNRKGMHLYTISYGSEKHLPTDLRRRIKSAYFDYLITLVIEVHSLGKTAWIAKVEDENRMITVKVVDDEMEETENFLKSK